MAGEGAIEETKKRCDDDDMAMPAGCFFSSCLVSPLFASVPALNHTRTHISSLVFITRYRFHSIRSDMHEAHTAHM